MDINKLGGIGKAGAGQPVTPQERKARVRWLLNHRVWGHPVKPFTVGWRKRDGEPPVVHDFHQDPYECIRVEYVYVDPTTETIEDDEARNTAFRCWVEAGPPCDLSTDKNMPAPPDGWKDYNRWGASHDFRLDCGAPTVEEALLKLADLVEKFYDEDGTEKLYQQENVGRLVEVPIQGTVSNGSFVIAKVEPGKEVLD